MTKYDVAAGVSQQGLDNLAAQLFAVPAAKQGLFAGTKTVPVDTLGDVTLTYQVNAAPTFQLRSPSEAEWAQAEKAKPNTPRPTENVAQLLFSDVSGTATIAGAEQPARGAITVYAVVSASGGAATIDVVAVDIDESSFTAWDRLIVNQILIPQALEMGNKLLSGLPIPKLPEIASLTFEPTALDVEPGGIVIGTTITGGGATELAGFAFPAGKDFFALTTLHALDTLSAKNVQSSYQREDSSGGSAFKASGRVKAAAVKLTAAISGTKFVANVQGSFSAYGELSGTGVGITKAVMCPIGAAADAISNPSDWDKVISSFALGVKPLPLPIPISFTAGDPTANGKQPVSITIDVTTIAKEIDLTVAPKWSGSVTGSALAAAASAFVDMIPNVFEQMILEDILKKHVPALSYNLPKMSETINLSGGAKITATVSLPKGAVLVPLGTDQLLQGLSLSVS